MQPLKKVVHAYFLSLERFWRFSKLILPFFCFLKNDIKQRFWSEFGDFPSSLQTHVFIVFCCFIASLEKRNEFGVSLEILQPDPWPLAKITINMDSPSQWVSKMGRLFSADEYVRHAVETTSHKQQPQQHTALKAVPNVLADLETRVIEFISEWLVALLSLQSMSWKLGHLICPSCCSKNIGSENFTSVLMSQPPSDRKESYTKTIDGQIRFFPSNAFMALARSLLAFNRSKKMNCKLSCNAV